MKLKNYPWWRNKPINLHQTRSLLHKKLIEHNLETPGLTSLILLEHVLGREKSWILAHSEYHPDLHEQQTLQENLTQLVQGVPLPYVLGKWDFFGRTFCVTKDVLIPRPETELLVEQALQHLEKYRQPNALDVGTGSGAVAISLSAEHPNARVTATDISRAALRVARDNAIQLGKANIQFLQSDLLSPLRTSFDLICANLPYIPTQTLETLTVAQWEPYLALDGGATGLTLIQCLLMQAQTRLAGGGLLLVETEASLGIETLTAARASFPQAECQIITDLSGHDRLLRIQQA